MMRQAGVLLAARETRHIIRLQDMAAQAARDGQPLPPAYWRCARWWEALGYPAFLAMLAVYYLMVNKPDWALG